MPRRSGGVVPPLLGQQKTLLDQIERRLAPGRVVEPVVLRQRLNAGRRLRVLGGTRGVEGEPQRLARRLVHELRLLAGREPEMYQPVDIGPREHDRRDAISRPADRGVQRPVHGLEGLRGRGWRLESLGRDRRPKFAAPGSARSARPGCRGVPLRRRLRFSRAGLDQIHVSDPGRHAVAPDAPR
jgi:hypothetical protein